jgi:beta-fructofuranosidase
MAMNRRGFVAMVAGGVAGLMAGARNLYALSADSPLAHDNDRPDFHLLPPHNWMNDPNGPIWWKGNYHLFYQLNPNAAVWGDMHWGHAVCRDMIHWQHEPIALAPTPGGADSEGCFSGSAVIYRGVPTFIFTGVKRVPSNEATILDSAHNLREVQMIAVAEDDSLVRWKKLEKPVIAAPPAGLNATGFRDPCLWMERGADGKEEWLLIVGSGVRGVGGCALLYRAKPANDLREWEYLHPLAFGQKNKKIWPETTSDTVDSGEMWECPDFFALDGNHCLLYSTERKVIWSTGEYRELKFNSKQIGLLDHGAFYAPKSFMTPDGRRILWGWIQETRPEAEFARAGWAGVMSLPRELDVNKSGNLTIKPATEVLSLRGAKDAVTIKEGAPVRRKLATLRREIVIDNVSAKQGLTLRLNQKGKTLWQLTLDGFQGLVHVEATEFKLPLGEMPALRLFLDGSVIEAFFGETEALTARVYGLLPGEAELELTSAGEGAISGELFELKTISPDKMTSEYHPT